MTSLHVAVDIARPVADVVAVAGDPRRLGDWASGLGAAVEPAGDGWLVDSPMGRITVVFAPPNPFGVLDHDVTLPDGQTFHNPLRVLADGDGSEIVFTLRRAPGVSDADFERDAATVRSDLETLRDLVEESGQ